MHFFKKEIITQASMTYSNNPYDEAYDISQDLSMAESFDGRDKEKVRTYSITRSHRIEFFLFLIRYFRLNR